MSKTDVFWQYANEAILSAESSIMLPPVTGERRMPAQPIPALPGLLMRLACPKCSTPMVLTHLIPDKPGFDSRTFDCPKCGQSETEVFEIL